MKVVKWIIVVVASILGLFVLVTFFLPKDYHVERSVDIDAPRGIIYTQVADLKAWQTWNPWNEMDPDMVLIYGDKTQGVGASYEWKSEIAGNGKMSIIEADPPNSLRYELIFEGYEETPSFSSITIDGSGMVDPVDVTWSFEGSVGDKLFARWMTIMIDKFVGSSYEEGLKMLKARCENMEVESLDTESLHP